MDINEVELASNLAEKRTIEEVFVSMNIKENDLYVSDEEGNLSYKDFVQDIFNRWYDFYLTEIETTKLKIVSCNVSYN